MSCRALSLGAGSPAYPKVAASGSSYFCTYRSLARDDRPIEDSRIARVQALRGDVRGDSTSYKGPKSRDDGGSTGEQQAACDRPAAGRDHGHLAVRDLARTAL